MHLQQVIQVLLAMAAALLLTAEVTALTQLLTDSDPLLAVAVHQPYEVNFFPIIPEVVLLFPGHHLVQPVHSILYQVLKQVFRMLMFQ